eukprot:EG_transcript_16412
MLGNPDRGHRWDAGTGDVYGLAMVTRELAWYDTAFHCPSNERTYVFKDDVYWRYDGNRLDPGYPKRISEGWPGIPSAVQAAYQEAQGDKIYFFKGDLYWRYTKTTEAVDAGYPKRIKDEFEGRAVARPAIHAIGQAPLYLHFRGGHCQVELAPGLQLLGQAPDPHQQRRPAAPLPRPVPSPKGAPSAVAPPYTGQLATALGVPANLEAEEVEEIDSFIFGLPRFHGTTSPMAGPFKAASEGWKEDHESDYGEDLVDLAFQFHQL